MKNRCTFILLALAILASVSGCAVQQTKITSNKASSYNNEPKRLFVVTDIGTDFGESFADAFQSKFATIVKLCNADSEISRVVIYDRASVSRQLKMKEFAPDTMLLIKRNGGTTRQSALISVIYDVKLIDVKTDSTVWRAEVNFEKGDVLKLKERGEVLALELTGKMKEDQLFRSCQSSN